MAAGLVAPRLPASVQRNGPATANEWRLKTLLSLALILITAAVYWQVTDYDFINYDDPLYVTENPQVQAGLTQSGMIWAFTRLTGEETYWHPLTWLSHMLDCQFYGLNPSGHHFTNLLFHLVNVVVLFLALQRMTAAVWRSAAVAALFALHPLQVDTVAWITERKNVLGAFFGILTIFSYVRYAEKPGATRYALVVTCFLLGLMAKPPALAPLPWLLLLLDFWPLRRMDLPAWANRFLEPGDHLFPGWEERQSQEGADKPEIRKQVQKQLPPRSAVSIQRAIFEKIPLMLFAIAGSAITWMAHAKLKMMVYEGQPAFAERLANATVSCWRYLRRTAWPHDLAIFYPYSGATSLGLAIVLGSVMIGALALAIGSARRKPYVTVGVLWFLGALGPFIGLVQVGAQAMADRFVYFPIIGLFITVVWAAADWMTRWRHGRAALFILSAVVFISCAIATWCQVAHWKNSETLFRHALSVTTANYLAHNNLANALARSGRANEAKVHYTEALRIKPDYIDAYYNLGLIRANEGQPKEAIALYREALRLDPNHAPTLNNFAWLLAACPNAEYRNGSEAVRLAERACELTGYKRAVMIGTLAAAYAEAGRFPEAINAAEKARQQALATSQAELARKNQDLMELYKSGRPYSATLNAP